MNLWQRLFRRPRRSIHERSMRTTTFVAGEALRAGSLVYLEPNGKVYSDRLIRRSWWQRLLRRPVRYTPPVGIVLADVTEGAPTPIAVSGMTDATPREPTE